MNKIAIALNYTTFVLYNYWFMGFKTIIFFLSTCFAVLVSLQAIADDGPNPKKKEILILEGQKESIKSANKAKEAQSACGEENAQNEQNLEAYEGKSENINYSSGNSNISFSFIYYILYKFKYIDSFGLSTPEKKRVSNNQESVVWH